MQKKEEGRSLQSLHAKQTGGGQQQSHRKLSDMPPMPDGSNMRSKQSLVKVQSNKKSLRPVSASQRALP